MQDVAGCTSGDFSFSLIVKSCYLA